MGRDKPGSDRVYEKIFSWDVDIDIPVEIRNQIRERIEDSLERYAYDSTDKLSFVLHLTTGSGIGLMPDPFVQIGSYSRSGHELVDLYDGTVKLVRERRMRYETLMELCEKVFSEHSDSELESLATELELDNEELAALDSSITRDAISAFREFQDSSIDVLGFKSLIRDVKMGCEIMLPALEDPYILESTYNAEGKECKIKIIIGYEPRIARIELVE
jgi:hypothetical protein